MTRKNKPNGFKIVKVEEGDVDSLEPFDGNVYLSETDAVVWLQKYISENIVKINTLIVVPATQYDADTYPRYKNDVKRLKEKIPTERAELLKAKGLINKTKETPDFTQWQKFDEDAKRGDSVIKLEKFLRETFKPDEMLVMIVSRFGLHELKHFSIDDAIGKRFKFWNLVTRSNIKPPVFIADYVSNSLATFERIIMWRKVELRREIKLID